MRMKGVTEMETYMQMLGRLAKNASRGAAKLGTKAKNKGRGLYSDPGSGLLSIPGSD